MRGTYGQRQPEAVHMLRGRFHRGSLRQRNCAHSRASRPAPSRVRPHQRQNVQLHFVPLAQVEDAMRALADTGLTTREACGNSNWNITACPYAGVAEGEIFDVTPYAEAMTRVFSAPSALGVAAPKLKIARRRP